MYTPAGSLWCLNEGQPFERDVGKRLAEFNPTLRSIMEVTSGHVPNMYVCLLVRSTLFLLHYRRFRTYVIHIYIYIGIPKSMRIYAEKYV
jgi:hypothetical protein